MNQQLHQLMSGMGMGGSGRSLLPSTSRRRGIQAQKALPGSDVSDLAQWGAPFPSAFGPDFPFAMTPFSAGSSPPVDVVETDSNYVVKMDVPGVSKNDVNVTVDDDILTIVGSHKEERDEDRGTWHVMERSWGSFKRSFALPHDIDKDKLEAVVDNGLLSVTIPKSAVAEGQHPKRIEVKEISSAKPLPESSTSAPATSYMSGTTTTGPSATTKTQTT